MSRDFKYISLVGDEFPNKAHLERFLENSTLSASKGKFISSEASTEGSFSACYLLESGCVRWTPEHLGDKFIKRVLECTRQAYEQCLTCKLYSFGYVLGRFSNQLMGFLIFMEKLDALPREYADLESVFSISDSISRCGFHNDFKIDNLMMSREGGLYGIDFDYFSPSKICIAVSSFQTIELDLLEFLKSVPDNDFKIFRSFYDLFYLSLSIPGSHPLYRPLLERLSERFRLIQASILEPLLTHIGPDKAVDLPMEILVRCPGIDAVSVNLTDVRGNAFAHQQTDWETFPYIIKSRGVYWP